MARGGVTARVSVGPPNCVWDGWVLQTGLNHRKNWSVEEAGDVWDS